MLRYFFYNFIVPAHKFVKFMNDIILEVFQVLSHNSNLMIKFFPIFPHQNFMHCTEF